jgi:hypothetical protein
MIKKYRLSAPMAKGVIGYVVGTFKNMSNAEAGAGRISV